MLSNRTGTTRTLAVGPFILLATAACGGGIHDSPGIGVLSDPRFRSFTNLPITGSNGIDCLSNRNELATGDRPFCANTIWVSSNSTCRITGLRSWGCACYEGQAHACDETTGGPCTLGAANCGVQACLVNSDTSSVWSACSLL